MNHLPTVLEAMQLLEDDYLGGFGSRGGGKVRFVKLAITARGRDDYGAEKVWEAGRNRPVSELLTSIEGFNTWVREVIRVS